MNELISTFTGQLAGESQPLVNARDLHEFLGSKQDFSNWIKSRIEQCRFKEGESYSTNLLNRSFGIGRPKTEYHISLRMAEHLGMMENSERGYEIRDYFCRVEKQARQQIPAEHQIAVLRSALLETNPVWQQIRRYHLASLTQKEMLRLLDIGDTALRNHLRHMALCGLIDYQPNKASSAGGKALQAKKLAVQNVH